MFLGSPIYTSLARFYSYSDEHAIVSRMSSMLLLSSCIPSSFNPMSLQPSSSLPCSYGLALRKPLLWMIFSDGENSRDRDMANCRMGQGRYYVMVTGSM